MSAVPALLRLSEVLQLARLRDASDVHIAPDMPPALRINGVLEVTNCPATSAAETAALIDALFDEKQCAKLASAGECGGVYRDRQHGNVRVHAYRTSGGISLAVRMLARAIPALETLHLPAAVVSLAGLSHGLVVFTGPTGSGKSTALAALLDRINRTQAKHIVTIEDPVEYVHISATCVVSQREVGRDSESFAQAVHGALRSDPDVILLGEMRDAATMHAAVTAAETGHLIFTTLHTADAAQAVDRIVGVFDGTMQEQIRTQLAQTLAAVVCLRLVPRSSEAGRRCAAEVLVATDAARSLIREGKTHQLRGLMETSRALGMQTLEWHLGELAACGEISGDAARAACVRENELRIFTAAS